ncbi:hypothetical protein AB8998_09285 [Mycobacterium sp. HUMS_12744610]|uniref:PE family protein n=1 Tax=Mycobacterium servetii TaxID=3237418 RepID=A0ABV4BYW5_9MYCO
MGRDALQVVPAELAAAAGQWRALSSQLTGVASPSPGPSFQPTTVAVNGVNAAIGVAAAAFTARTQTSAAAVTTAADGYTSQEAGAAGQMSDITQQVRMA